MSKLWNKIKDKPVSDNMWLTIVALAFVCGLFIGAKFFELKANEAIIDVIETCNQACPALANLATPEEFRDYVQRLKGNLTDSPIVDHPYS